MTEKFPNAQPKSPEKPKKDAFDYKDILKQAGYKENDGIEEWRKQAAVYTHLFYILVSKVTDNAEFTHSEFVGDPKEKDIIRLSQCVDMSKKAWDALLLFLEKNSDLIPQDFRKKFEMYAGFNFGKKGGIFIGDGSMTRITQQEYESKTDGQYPPESPIYPNPRETLDEITAKYEKMHIAIQQAVDRVLATRKK